MNTADNYAFDAAIRSGGYPLLCGVDEAGRGPLAGPVYAAAVILDPADPIEGINDSKKIPEARREALFEEITRRAAGYAVASASVEEIERLNILQATYLAMRRAVEALSPQPDAVLIDGNRIPPGITVPVRAVVKGDSLSASIAAASILAKVSRDRVLRELDKRYPAYGFAVHKGYGTKAHYAALREHGVTPEHRLSFLKKVLAAQAED